MVNTKYYSHFFPQIPVHKKEMLEFVREMYPDFILTISLAVVNYFHMEAVEGTPTILRLLTNVPAIVEVLVKMFSYFLIFKVCILLHKQSTYTISGFVLQSRRQILKLFFKHKLYLTLLGFYRRSSHNMLT